MNTSSTLSPSHPGKLPTDETGRVSPLALPRCFNFLPVGWKSVSLGEVLVERRETARPDLPLLSITSGAGIIPQSGVNKRDTSNSDKGKYLAVHSGDLAYNTMRMWQGVSGLSRYTGIVSPAYTVCSTKDNVDAKYISYLFKHPDVVNTFRRLSQGLVDDTLSLKFAALKTIPVYLPPLPEQRRIAEVLSSVDDAIEATEGVIARLTTVKRGLMQTLLTRGIPGRHERFKQTEVGEVPEGWEVRLLGECVLDIKNGIYKPQGSYGNGTSILRIDSYNDGDKVSGGNLKRVACSDSEKKQYALKPGDIIINRVNSITHLGKAAMVGNIVERTVFESNMMRVSLLDDLRSEYAIRLLCLPLVRGRLLLGAKRAVAQSSINQGDVRSLTIPLPPLPEQQEIAAILDAADARINAERVKAARLRTLKRGLMEQLLTGQLRVPLD